MANKFDFIFLGAGPPFIGELHTSLRFANESRRVLDWNLLATQHLNPNYIFVSGYQADAVKEKYPEFIYVTNNEWNETKAGWSLIKSLSYVKNNVLYVAYSDILFRREYLEKINSEKEADIVIGVDTQWENRYEGRTSKDLETCEKVNTAGSHVTYLSAAIIPSLATAEFIGLAKFSNKAVEELKLLPNKKDLQKFLREAKLSELIEYLRTLGLSVEAVDVKGNWAQLNEAPAPSDG